MPLKKSAKLMKLLEDSSSIKFSKEWKSFSKRIQKDCESKNSLRRKPKGKR